MLYGATDGSLYCVIDQTVYYIDPNFNYTNLGALLTPAGTPVIACDNGTSAVLVDGTAQGYQIVLAPNLRAMTQIGDPNFYGSDGVDFLDYFLIFNQPGTPNFYCTTANAVAFNALFIGTKTAWPDNIIRVVTCERLAWVFGPKKSEIWFNAGSVPFPLQSQPGLIIEHGCAAKYSPAKQDINVYWLSQSPEGARMVMKGAQQTAVRISTHAIENEFLKYSRVDDAIGTTYQIEGHAFYCLHFPTADKTWVFDEATQQWHEETWIDKNGIAHRARNTFCAVAYGMNIGMDWQTGQLYKIDPTNFTDNGDPVEYIRSFSHVMDTDNDLRLTVWKLIADTEVGTGTGTQLVPTQNNPWSLGFSPGFGPLTLTEPPLISLRTSRNRGASYGNAVTQPMGAGGLYYTRPTWNRLGFANDWVFELSWSTPMKTALNGAFITVEAHAGDE